MAGRTAVWRVDVGAGPRLAVGPLDEGPSVFLPPALRVADLLQPGPGSWRPSTTRTCGRPG
jgi:hypothetical protein